MSSLSLLRRQLRQQRRRVLPHQHRQSEIRILNQLRRLAVFQHSQHIGVYLHAFGEIYTRQLILACFKQQKKVYLPMVCAMNQHLVWVQISQQQYLNQRFAPHRLGMQQAMHSRGHRIERLDLVFMPLLACDQHGTRLGMGGGFYDKTLSRAPRQPFRLGLAHDFQLLSTPLQRQPWDQPLDALLTPSQYRSFKR